MSATSPRTRATAAGHTLIMSSCAAEGSFAIVSTICRCACDGYGIARRIEQISGNLLLVNYGTLYPALLKLEQEGYIKGEWGTSDNNRRARFYQLTKAGKKQVARETAEWTTTTEILARFLTPDQA